MALINLYFLDDSMRDIIEKFDHLLCRDCHVKVKKPESPQELPRNRRASVTFQTSSNYAGEWSALGMDGWGTYKMSSGTIYNGQMKDGMFHGEGILYLPNSSYIKGIWKKGKLDQWQICYRDRECQVKDYCKMPDRRFFTERRYSFQPACHTKITNVGPPREIPQGFYDAGDGFYNPKIKCVVDMDDYSKIIRIPTRSEAEWIVLNCRHASTVPVGYRPDLYENNFKMPKRNNTDADSDSYSKLLLKKFYDGNSNIFI